MRYLNSAVNLTEKSTVYSDEMGWWELPQRCECGWPLHLTSGGSIPFCPKCANKRELAIQGRSVLVRAILRYEDRNRRDVELNLLHDEALRLNAYGAFAAGLPA